MISQQAKLRSTKWMFNANPEKQIQVCVRLGLPCSSKVLTKSLRSPSSIPWNTVQIQVQVQSSLDLYRGPSNHGLKQYKYNIHVQSTSVQFILIHNESSIHHNWHLHSKVPHTQLRPYRGPPSYKHWSFITDYITGSPLRNPRFRSSNFHLINRFIIISMT